MTFAATGETSSAPNPDGSPLSKLKDLLARTSTAYDLMVTGNAAPAMLQMIRVSLGQVQVKLAEQYLAIGNIPDAIEICREASSLQPRDRDISLLFIRALLAANDTAGALPVLVQAALDHDDDASIQALLAQVYVNTGRPVDAVAAFRRALVLQPGDVTLMAAFANALVGAGQVGEALPVWRQVLAATPDNVDHLWRYGSLCNDSGAFDEARAAFARLTVLQPGRGLYHRLFGKLHVYTAHDPHIAEMERVLGDADPSGDDARELHFALFTAFETLGDDDCAFDHLKSANDIRKRQLDYRPDVYNRLFDNIATAFDPDRQPAFAPSPRDESPIFIVGMPRSGSTLVEQILDSHPDASAAGESLVFGTLVEKNFLTRDLSYDLRALGDAGSIAAIGESYLAGIGKSADRTRRTVDKYLTNFLSIGIIKAIFPRAKIVHCHRNPLANCFSAYASHFETNGLGFKADMEETARYYVRYHRLMQFWKKLHGEEILDLSYEALTLDQEAGTRRLLDYCGLDWDPACMDFHKNDRMVKTASYMQVRRPIYSGVDRRTARYIRHLEPMILILREAGLHPPGDAG